MTKAEKKQVEEVWVALENIVTVMDPGFDVKAYCKQCNFDKKSFDQIQELIDFIRIEVKYQLFNSEALERESDILLKLIEDSKG